MSREKRLQKLANKLWKIAEEAAFDGDMRESILVEVAGNIIEDVAVGLKGSVKDIVLSALKDVER